MKNKLLIFYTEKVRARKLIYSKMNFLFWSYLISYTLALPLIIIALCIWFWTEKSAYGPVLSAIALVIFLIFIHRGFNSKARIILNREFSIKTEKGKWLDGFHEVQIHMITEYLIEHDLYSKWKIENLMEAYKADNTKEKMPPLVAPSILIAVLAPNLNYFLKHFYEATNFQTNEGQFLIFSTVLLFSIFFVVVITFWKYIFEEFSEILLYKRINYRNNLNSILYDILIGIES
ncbi:hypothetical protein NSQ38_18960 [Paenibacillus sp. FSL R7-0313]|uniref:hypothetical protein n=1 Tax=Paenibacillus sp. FSL R7-0313 TaxID=2954532 RepID=UPI0030D6F6E3